MAVEIQHKDLTDPQLHEPKGISTAAAGQVYIADGLGSGLYRELTPYDLAFTISIFTNTSLTTDIAPRVLQDGLTGELNNTVTDASSFEQVNKNCKELAAQLVNAYEMITVLKTNIAELNRVVSALKTQTDALSFTGVPSNA